jgi:hypothetical protein
MHIRVGEQHPLRVARPNELNGLRANKTNESSQTRERKCFSRAIALTLKLGSSGRFNNRPDLACARSNNGLRLLPTPSRRPRHSDRQYDRHGIRIRFTNHPASARAGIDRVAATRTWRAARIAAGAAHSTHIRAAGAASSTTSGAIDTLTSDANKRIETRHAITRMVFAYAILRIACLRRITHHAVAYRNATNRVDTLLRCWAFRVWIAKRDTLARRRIACIRARALHA